MGQTVTLKCVSDGVPTPTLTWYKPDGNQIMKVTATQNTVNVKMTVDQDFGGYKCEADNGLTPADYKIVKVDQISKWCLSLLGVTIAWCCGVASVVSIRVLVRLH